MKDGWRSPHLEAAAACAQDAARAAGLSPREARALAQEELRLLERVGEGRRQGSASVRPPVGGASGAPDRYASLRRFLEALCSPTG